MVGMTREMYCETDVAVLDNTRTGAAGGELGTGGQNDTSTKCAAAATTATPHGRRINTTSTPNND